MADRRAATDKAQVVEEVLDDRKNVPKFRKIEQFHRPRPVTFESRCAVVVAVVRKWTGISLETRLQRINIGSRCM